MGYIMHCTNCHKLLSNLWDRYEHFKKNNYTSEESLKCINIDRDCCKQIMLTSVNISKKLNHFRMQLYTRQEALGSTLKATTVPRVSTTVTSTTPLTISKTNPDIPNPDNDSEMTTVLKIIRDVVIRGQHKGS